jgi:hypothetical protein
VAARCCENVSRSRKLGLRVLDFWDQSSGGNLKEISNGRNLYILLLFSEYSVPHSGAGWEARMQYRTTVVASPTATAGKKNNLGTPVCLCCTHHPVIQLNTGFLEHCECRTGQASLTFVEGKAPFGLLSCPTPEECQLGHIV